jgi:single-strand DNA-binding protein
MGLFGRLNMETGIASQPIPPIVSNWLDRNEIHLCGELTRDPEARYTSSGKMVCNFSLATKIGEARTFHNCVCWEALAEKVATLKNPPTKKRQRLKVVGRLQTRTWETRDGEKRSSTEVVCRQIAVEGGEVKNDFAF